MSRNETKEAVSVVSFISRSFGVYKWNPISKVWIIDIINIFESEIKGIRFYSSFVFDKLLYKLCLIGAKQIDKDSGTVCSHGDVRQWFD